MVLEEAKVLGDDRLRRRPAEAEVAKLQREALLQVTRGQLGIGHDDVGHCGQPDCRHQVALGAIGEVFIKRTIDGRCPQIAQQDCVAVGCRLCHYLRSDVASGSGLVVHYPGLTPAQRKSLGDATCEAVGRATRALRDNEPDGLAREIALLR